MRFIFILISVMIIGFLVVKLLNGVTQEGVSAAPGSPESQVPRVPSKPQEIRKFEKDMTLFLQKSTTEKVERAEQY
jgi:hypothetical protein